MIAKGRKKTHTGGVCLLQQILVVSSSTSEILPRISRYNSLMIPTVTRANFPRDKTCFTYVLLLVLLREF